jgi:membrane-bound serine protease (ClpP class)
MTWRRAIALASLLLSISAPGKAQERPRPLAVVAELDGIVQPVAAEYLDQVIDEADRSAATVVIVVLRTPGGLLDSTRDIVSRLIASRAPVVMFVGPAGARAASAGFILTLAADVVVMAPGTHIGAAHPVAGNGAAMDETMSAKVVADTAAYARSLAEARGRNAELAAAAVTESRAFTDREALAAMPPLADFSAPDIAGILRQLDGRTVRRFDGRTQRLETSDAAIRRVDMSRRQRFLSGIADPQVAYWLLTLGLIGLTVELWNPGMILPGVAGGVCLLLAVFAFQILPVNTTGLLLVLFGLGLLILELKIPSFGVLGVGGTLSLVLGSVMMARGVPGVEVGLGAILPPALALSALMLGLGRLALQAQRRPVTTGVDAMLGTSGRARTAVTAETPGQVDVRGELWRAVSGAPVAPGQPVRIVAINGLTLVVEPIPQAGPSR